MAENTAPGVRVQNDLQSGRQAFLAGDFSKAKFIVEQLVEQHPLDFDCLLLKGAIHMQLNDFAGAEEAWLRALEGDPRSVVAHTNLGILYQASSRLDQAEQRFKTALSHDPAHYAATLELVGLLRRTRRLEEAEWFARRGVSHASQSAEAFDLLGLILQDESKLDEAEAAFRSATSLNALNSNYALHLGYLLLSQGRWAEGFQLCERRHAHDLNFSTRFMPACRASRCSNR